MGSPGNIAAVDDGTFPKNLRPPVSTFGPSMWGDTFSSYSVDDQLQEEYVEALETLKEEARKMLIVAKGSKRIDKLTLIDTLERLGVAYHFEEEIEQQLQLIFQHHSDTKIDYTDDDDDDDDDDLASVALEFRLLRQHRYSVSCGVFDKFKDKDNKFEERISRDAEGLLSLYEAGHARIHGEEILDEAVAYAKQHLNHLLPELTSPPLHDKVKRALEQSLDRGVPIVEARYYINIYEKDDKRNELLLKLAKVNFNFLQNLYKKELYEVSRWWNKFDLKSKLPYARDRWVECYFWGVAFHFEPQYSYVRIATTKSMQLVSVVDDTYDNYATIEEGELFTKILERWDIGEIEPLPDFMKIVYNFVLSTYEDFELEASKHETSYMIPYAIEAVKQIGRAYLKELQWFNGRQLPDFEEYFANTVITSCIYLMYIPCFIGMKSASLRTVQWLVDRPKLLVAMAKMGRHVENLGSWERESRDGQMLTVVDCYMEKHGLTREETLAKFIELADEGWKDLNTEMLNVTSTTGVSKDIADMFLNYARISEITYKNCEDGYTYPEKFLAPQMVAVLIDPIVL